MHPTPDSDFLGLQRALAGRYSLERELGRGGMGIVYLAHEVRLDRPVALKLLPPEYAARSNLRERFLREARTAAKLSHPHIVAIHAVDEVDDFVFFAMAYVEGESLGQRVRERGPVPPTEAARILREVAWALAHAHAQGVVHRDVKPDNILLEAGTGRPLVTDFGIAHVGERAGLTTGAEILGTAEFMSPEQASGEAVDARSDIYSLGIVGHYMLSGKLPFEGATVAATLARQITQAAPALAAVAPETPAPLARAIDRCLEKDPAERFADGAELADAIGSGGGGRRDIPLPLRAFMEQVDTASGAMTGLGLMAVLCVIVGLFVLDEGGPALVTIVDMALAFVFAAIPVGMLAHMTRRLLRAGYGHDELLRALRARLDERREALGAAGRVEPSWLDGAGRLAVGSLAVYVAGLGWMALGPYVPGFEQIFLPIMSLAGFTFLGSGLVAAVRQAVSGQVSGHRWLRFWQSLPGRLLFDGAGVGLKRLPGAGASYRPTEVAIAMAADRLYDELPAEVRRSFPDLPEVVETLERHAESMRRRIGELDGVLREVEDGRDREGRLALEGDVRGARAAAEARLAEVVRALETLRLELLRLHAGVGSVQSMTADLGSAAELARSLSGVREARREVERLLGAAETEPETGDTPVPV